MQADPLGQSPLGKGFGFAERGEALGKRHGPEPEMMGLAHGSPRSDLLLEIAHLRVYENRIKVTSVNVVEIVVQLRWAS